MPGLRYDEHISTYRPMYYVEDERGYIVWRIGTGHNVELLHIRAKEPRRGYGTSLVVTMLRDVEAEIARTNQVPHSVFGFTRQSNEAALAFYGSLGFTLDPILDLYREGPAVLFSQEYARLRERLL